jgi:hypothetical protein
MTTMMLVFSGPVPGREADYDQWYEHTHLPELLALPGFISAQRWSQSSTAASVGGDPPHGNLAMYELEGDGEKAFAAMMDAFAAGTVHMTDAIDQGTIRLWAFNEHGARQVSIA